MLSKDMLKKLTDKMESLLQKSDPKQLVSQAKKVESRRETNLKIDDEKIYKILYSQGLDLSKQEENESHEQYYQESVSQKSQNDKEPDFENIDSKDEHPKQEKKIQPGMARAEIREIKQNIGMSAEKLQNMENYYFKLIRKIDAQKDSQKKKSIIKSVQGSSNIKKKPHAFQAKLQGYRILMKFREDISMNSMSEEEIQQKFEEIMITILTQSPQYRKYMVIDICRIVLRGVRLRKYYSPEQWLNELVQKNKHIFNIELLQNHGIFSVNKEILHAYSHQKQKYNELINSLFSHKAIIKQQKKKNPKIKSPKISTSALGYKILDHLQQQFTKESFTQMNQNQRYQIVEKAMINLIRKNRESKRYRFLKICRILLKGMELNSYAAHKWLDRIVLKNREFLEGVNFSEYETKIDHKTKKNQDKNQKQCSIQKFPESFVKKIAGKLDNIFSDLCKSVIKDQSQQLCLEQEILMEIMEKYSNFSVKNLNSTQNSTSTYTQHFTTKNEERKTQLEHQNYLLKQE